MKTRSISAGLTNIRRSPFQALAAICVLAVTFFVITLLSILTYSTQNLLKYFETRPQIIAFIKNDTKEDAILALKDKISSDSRIKKVTYVTQAQALEIYKGATKDNPLLGELVSPSIFPPSLEMTLSDINFAKDFVSEIKNEPIIQNVGITASLGGESSLTDVVGRLKSVTYSVRLAGFGLVTVLGLTSLFVLIVIIGMRVATRREEVEILTLIGATRWFIRKPVVVEALFYALVGAFTGWGLSVVLLLYATPSLLAYFGDMAVLPRQPGAFFGLLGIIFLAEAVVACLIAIVGSVVALSRANKKR